ncbi:putative glutamate decarboxylase [Kockovaella imperatae]|uniref:Glutamate decarboxylase n=1 Tax=Kockovaella imperatae TaxID=4999 RepID=A0A1Y1UAF6_9TREE|nr:putative glutamate decarboxylase [Kockovaella imperatae]ORX35018.1 putative glutamate decarboxylase [Kockovaella imperatae]
MALGRHVDADKLIAASRDHPAHKHTSARHDLHDNPFLSRYDVETELPKYRLPDKGADGKVVYQILHDELMLDGNPSMNLASFVNTWAPDEARTLMMENLNKNLVDQDEYPAAQEIHERCVSMISHLWHAPPENKAMGTATTGSSEAIMLGGMALKRKWQERMKAKGKDIHNPGPNIVMGAEAQVALEKFARYFEVEARLVPVTKESNYAMSAKDAMKYVDENTIGIFVIMGSTYTGTFESVQEMSDELDKYEAETGNYVPIHVDAASGGFVAPFVYPHLTWDFKLPRVHSINTSGHKYGMSTVGVGWIIWRGADYLPKELIFELHYLGATDYSFNLNFSRPAHPILAQMFNFLNLGFDGYRRIMVNNLSKARLISRALEGTGWYTCVSNVHIPKAAPSQSVGEKISQVIGHVEKKTPAIDGPEHYLEGLPVVSFRFSDQFKAENPGIKQSWIQLQLRGLGWIVPNYPLPPSCDDTEILRVVVRESLSGDLARKLIEDIVQVTEQLLSDQGPSLSMSTANKVRRSTGPGSEDRSDGIDKDHASQNTKTWAKPC